MVYKTGVDGGKRYWLTGSLRQLIILITENKIALAIIIVIISIIIFFNKVGEGNFFLKNE